MLLFDCFFNKIIAQYGIIKSMKKNYIYISLVIIFLGLFSRYGFIPFPSLVGNIIWATFIYFVIRIIYIKQKKYIVAIISSIFLILIEFSQLYHAPWINDIRNFSLAGIVLGYCFHYDDLLSYIFGVFVGFMIDKRLFTSIETMK